MSYLLANVIFECALFSIRLPGNFFFFFSFSFTRFKFCSLHKFHLMIDHTPKQFNNTNKLNWVFEQFSWTLLSSTHSVSLVTCLTLLPNDIFSILGVFFFFLFLFYVSEIKTLSYGVFFALFHLCTHLNALTKVNDKKPKSNNTLCVLK